MLSGNLLNDNYVLVSFDVTSLFTNIPLDLELQGIRNRWGHIKNLTKILMDDFISAVELILSSTFFTFDNIIYKQIFGTLMRSPLSSVIADIVMQEEEYRKRI